MSAIVGHSQQRIQNAVLNAISRSGYNVPQIIRTGLADLAGRIGRATTERAIASIRNDFEQLTARLPGIGQEVLNTAWEAATNALRSTSELGTRERQDSVPDIGDLVPHEEGAIVEFTGNDNNQLSRNVRPRMEDRRDPDGDQQMEAFRAPGNTSEGSAVQRETPVLYKEPTYGLQDTHTTTLPMIFWCSARNITYNGTKLALRMNRPWDVLNLETINTTYSDDTDPARDRIHIQRAWDTHKSHLQGATHKAHGNRVSLINSDIDDGPTNQDYVSSPSAVTRTWFWDYWAKIYQYYTVIACHYEITLCNARSGRYGVYRKELPIIIDTENPLECFDLTAAHTMNSFKTGEANENKLPDLTHIMMMGQEGINYTHVPEQQNGQRTEFATIKGTYKPGSIHRNVRNDQDYKTWLKTLDGFAIESPQLVEELDVRLYPNPLSNSTIVRTLGGGDPPNGGNHCNIQVRMKYVVQFKDRVGAFKYPGATTGIAGVDLTAPDDLIYKLTG